MLRLICFYGEGGAILTSTYNIGFYGELWKIIPKLSSYLLLCISNKSLLVQYPEGFLRIVLITISHETEVPVVSRMRVDHGSQFKDFPNVRKQGNQLVFEPVLWNAADTQFGTYRVVAFPAGWRATIASLSYKTAECVLKQCPKVAPRRLMASFLSVSF